MLKPHNYDLFFSNAATVFRAGRKYRNVTQKELCSELGISQGALSKLEQGLLKPTTGLWFRLCDYLGVSPDAAFRYGLVDHFTPARVESGDVVAGFKRLPERYAGIRGTKTRAVYPLLRFLQSRLSAEDFYDYFSERGLDVDFFFALDNEISFRFVLDLLDSVSRTKVLSGKTLAELAPLYAVPAMRPGRAPPSPAAVDGFARIREVVAHSGYFDSEFRFEIERKKGSDLGIRMVPAPHLEGIMDERDREGWNKFSQVRAAHFDLVGNAPLTGPRLDVGLEVNADSDLYTRFIIRTA